MVVITIHSQHLIFFGTYDWTQYARVPDRLFQPFPFPFSSLWEMLKLL